MPERFPARKAFPIIASVSIGWRKCLCPQHMAINDNAMLFDMFVAGTTNHSDTSAPAFASKEP